MKILLILIFFTFSSTHAVIIDCEFVNGHINYGNDTLFDDYSCWGIGIDLSDNATHVTGYTGTHVSGYANIHVKGVFFVEELCPYFNVTVFPKKFSSIFPNLQTFYIENCTFDRIDGDVLEDFSNLRIFIFTQTLIKRVPGSLFSHNPNMRHIDFDDNLIVAVGRGLLDNLANLQRVYFQRNVCINKWATNPLTIRILIDALNDDCVDSEVTSTTEVTTTVTMSTAPPKCEVNNIIDFICGLDEDLEELKAKNQVLEGEVNTLKSEYVNIREILAELELRVSALESGSPAPSKRAAFKKIKE